LLDIYDAIAAMSVTAAGKTPNVWDVDELRDSVQTAHLPVRILLPHGTFSGGMGMQTFRPITLDSIHRGTWQIVDLCLWKPIGQGLGMRDIGAVLAEYCGAYATALVNRGRGTTQQSFITGWDITAGVYAYPEQSDVWFWGVRVVVQVDEIIS
jgi:hypothetical protein